jgi:hypothetical protein
LGRNSDFLEICGQICKRLLKFVSKYTLGLKH